MFKTIEEMEIAMSEEKDGENMFIMLDTIDSEKFAALGETTHWSIQDATGRNVVLEYNVHSPGKPIFYENTAGILTNNPDFQWHMTNLNNYVGLHYEEGGTSKEEHNKWGDVYGTKDMTHENPMKP